MSSKGNYQFKSRTQCRSFLAKIPPKGLEVWEVITHNNARQILSSYKGTNLAQLVQYSNQSGLNPHHRRCEVSDRRVVLLKEKHDNS